MELISNTAISLDGRTGRHGDPRFRLGSRRDLARMRALRATVDAVLVGGATFRAWPLAYTATPSRPLVQAVLTRRGLLAQAGAFKPHDDVEMVVLGGSALDAAAHAAAFSATVHTTAAPSLGWALDRLAAAGCRRVLLEGGGQLIHRALAEDRLDRLHLTLCPVVLGDAGPGLATGGLLGAAGRRLALEDCARDGDEVILCYRRRCARAG